MNLLGDSLKCANCKETLKAPLLLPCGHCVCKQHEDFHKDTTKEIFCTLCRLQHPIPPNGFVKVKPLESLLEKEIESIDLGEEYNSAREKFQRFNDLLDHLKTIKNDPEMKIHTVISELRNKVDLRREELKNEIDKESLKMIEKLDKFEKECKLNAESMKSDNKLDEKLETWSNDVKQWQQILNSFKRNENKWKAILIESSSNLKKIQSEIIKFNENLFLKRLNELKISNLFVSSDFYKISVNIEKLIEYKDIKCRTDLINHKVNAVGIDWVLNVDINQDEDTELEKTDNYIGVYLKGSQTPKVCVIRVEYDLVILDQLNMDKNIIIKRVNVFDSEGLWGFRKMIKLKELLNNYNLYNVEKDSCTVQAIIKKFEWI